MKASEITVRPAEPEELSWLAEIGLASWHKGLKPHVPPDVAARIESANPFVGFLREMGPRVLVGLINGRPAGIGACESGDDTISDVWVAPEWEGRGVGSALVKALEEAIACRGYAHAKIEVAAANGRARALYEHLGYEQLWREMKFDPVLQTALEKIGMLKRL